MKAIVSEWGLKSEQLGAWVLAFAVLVLALRGVAENQLRERDKARISEVEKAIHELQATLQFLQKSSQLQSQ